MKIFYTCDTSKLIPIWMYYVRTILDIFTSFINLFLLPFHKQIGNTWSAHMLRNTIKK